MLATENCAYYDIAIPNHELLEVRRSKISLHNAKAGHDYPAIRLPSTFSGLVGVPTRIFQTVHDGALAFLVVISSASKSAADKHENALPSAKASVFTRRRSPVRIRPSPLSFFQSVALEPFIEGFSDSRIMAKKKHDEEKKLHNSHEKLHNSHEPDLT